VLIDAFVRVGSDDREYVFRTRDLSPSGLFLVTRVGHIYPFEVGSALAVELYDYDQFVACTAVIVRIVREGTPEASRYPVGFGIRITDISADNRARLEAMLDGSHGRVKTSSP
jgi:hypothetical protein